MHKYQGKASACFGWKIVSLRLEDQARACVCVRMWTTLSEVFRNAQDFPVHQEPQTQGTFEISSIAEEDPFRHPYASLDTYVLLKMRREKDCLAPVMGCASSGHSGWRGRSPWVQ